MLFSPWAILVGAVLDWGCCRIAVCVCLGVRALNHRRRPRGKAWREQNGSTELLPGAMAARICHNSNSERGA